MAGLAHYDGLDRFAGTAGRSIHLAIGMFDGVHRGHRKVIESAIGAAAEAGGLAGALTFWPHPSVLFQPENPTPMILDPKTKRSELEKLRIDFMIEEPFTKVFAATESNRFVAMLKDKIPELASIHTGQNWRFGKGRLGDVALLKALADAEGVDFAAMECLYVEGERVSSTRVRNALSSGRIEEANRLLGYEYDSLGTVTEGKKVGRTIDAPTLNLPFEGDLAPCYGVYAVRVSRFDGDERLPGVANFGIRPTVNELKRPLLEAHVLGECPFGYGDRLRVEWIAFLRPEMKFDGIGALRARIAMDIEEARRLFQDSIDG
ncbi:MAG: riboflavin biosynthesis protein RibF [Opitutales bacterium TMED158]|nr:MAG: riboflavin biosynthesis protein RibF [Opitutales bacterium TMED158]